WISSVVNCSGSSKPKVMSRTLPWGRSCSPRSAKGIWSWGTWAIQCIRVCHTFGVGMAAPVAPNADDAGRDKNRSVENRRVEIVAI
ncbi:MAG: hypothetical protein ABI600_16930, partial [Luteolibacter sp.]